ncbi:MAG: hypothetical protein ACKOED_00135 [Aestuariivirga sp.]|uniref:hypothetical protein n=1 Tax=Aestuariivirga sp. TaxID=2650926 RepID=UPI0038D085C5
MEHGKDGQPDRQAPGSGEDELRRVLSLATRPETPPEAMGRLMARIAAEPQAAKVAILAPRPRRMGWSLAALPLAASLLLGVYLGAKGQLDFMLPTAITGGIAPGENVIIDDLGGMGDAAAENLS